MKLFKISQTANNDYDTYDSAVVAAETEDDARRLLPGEDARSDWYRWEDGALQFRGSGELWRGVGRHGVWATKLEDVSVEYLGEAKDGTEKGVILASFNAG